MRQSQQYVNSCRQAVGLSDIFWSGAFHDALKMTAVTCEQTLKRLTTLSARFTKAAVVREGTGTLRTSKSLLGLSANKDPAKTRKLNKDQQSEVFLSLDLRLPDEDFDDVGVQLQKQADAAYEINL